MKKRYELTVLFSPELSSQELDKIAKNLESLVSKYEGKFVKQEDWGKRELAYPIKKQNEAYFKYYEVEVPGKAIKELDKELKHTEQIWRYLFVKSDK